MNFKFNDLNKSKIFYFIVTIIFFITLMIINILGLGENSDNVKSVSASEISSEEISSLEGYDIESTAKAMYMFDANSDREIFKKNCDEKLALASTTKVLTAITTLENYSGDLDEKIQVPEDAVGLEGSSMYLKSGEMLSVRELLYGLMLPSGNDSAKALAILTSGTEEEFCNLMNQTALKAGAVNSHFANSHGLDDDNHYTTARDLALITAYALKNDIFRDIVSTKNVVINQTNKYETRFYKNKNKLLFEFDDCIGVKTGFTDNAGRCLVSAVESEGLQFICVVLNCPNMFEESTRLMRKAKAEYKKYNIIDKTDIIDTINVLNGKKNEVKIYPLESFDCVLNEEELENIDVEYSYPKEIDAPVYEFDNLGDIKVFVKEHLIFSTNLCSIDNIKSIKTKDLVKDILNNWS